MKKFDLLMSVSIIGSMAVFACPAAAEQTAAARSAEVSPPVPSAPPQTQPATAAPADDGLQDIVVTAQRRNQSLQKVPIAITAISGDNLSALGVRNAQDIQHFAPGVVFATTAGEGQKANVVIRGVGLNTSSETLESNVGIYQDDVYISSTSGFADALFDIDRVEVLRGPQGTLYGNTSTGGLIHYISKRPTETFEAYANLSYGSYNEVRMEGAVGGQVTQGVSVRVSGLFDRYDGYIKNAIGPDRNSEKLAAVRGQLLLEPIAGLSVLLRGHYSNNEPNSGTSFKPRVIYLNPASGLIEALPSNVNFFGAKSCAGCDASGNPGSIANGSIWNISANQDGALAVKTYGGGAEAKVELGFANLTSITDWEVVNKFFQEDSDAAPRTTVGQLSNLDAKQFQQEVRLSSKGGPIDWQVGGFYLRRDVDSLFEVLFLGSDGAFPPFNSIAPSERFRSRSYAAYGQAEVPLGEKFSVIGGLRYSRETSDDVGFNGRVFATGATTVTSSYNLTNSWEGVSGKVSLQYKPNSQALIYASYSRGLRPSNITNTGTVPAGVAPAVKGEKLNAYEAGFKYKFDDIPVRLNMAGFYYDYKDMQTRAFLGFSTYNLNVDARIYGADLEISARPFAGLDLSANASYIHGRVLDVARYGNVGPARDTELPNAPEFSGSVQARYEVPVGTAGNAYVMLSETYRAHTYAEIQNNPAQRVDSYFLTDGRIGFKTTPGGAEFGVFANNIFNKQYFNFIGAITSTGIAQQFPGRPRWVGVFANFKY